MVSVMPIKYEYAVFHYFDQGDYSSGLDLLMSFIGRLYVPSRSILDYIIADLILYAENTETVNKASRTLLMLSSYPTPSIFDPHDNRNGDRDVECDRRTEKNNHGRYETAGKGFWGMVEFINSKVGKEDNVMEDKCKAIYLYYLCSIINEHKNNKNNILRKIFREVFIFNKKIRTLLDVIVKGKLAECYDSIARVISMAMTMREVANVLSLSSMLRNICEFTRDIGWERKIYFYQLFQGDLVEKLYMVSFGKDLSSMVDSPYDTSTALANTIEEGNRIIDKIATKGNLRSNAASMRDMLENLLLTERLLLKSKNKKHYYELFKLLHAKILNNISLTDSHSEDILYRLTAIRLTHE